MMQPTTLLLLAALSALSQARAESPRPADSLDLDRSFDSFLWITAHNAANFGNLLPNQSFSLREQLERGVRGLMLDVWERSGSLYTCHQDCAFHGRVAPLEDDLSTIVAFLSHRPDAVVTLHLEDHYPRALMEALSRRRPDLFALSFDPTDPRWQTSSPGWPTLRQMIEAGQRLIITTQRSELGGTYPGSQAYFIHDQSLVTENYWSLGTTIFSHDSSCVARWQGVPLAQQSSDFGMRRLFVMNHFHGVPFAPHSGTDNRLDTVLDRLQAHCLPAAQRMPSFLALDFIDYGDMLELAESYNHGGIFAHPARGARGAALCTFSAAFSRRWALDKAPRMGCEDNAIQSLSLRGLRAGQRIILHADPGAASSDDSTVIEVLRDIPWEAPQTVHTLDVSLQTHYFRSVHQGSQGLDGRVSHISTEPSPADPSALARAGR